MADTPTADGGANGQPNSHGKRPAPPQKSGLGKKRQQKKMRKRERDMKNGSSDEVLAFDIRDLRDSLDEAASDEPPVDDEPLPEPGSEITVKAVFVTVQKLAPLLQKRATLEDPSRVIITASAAGLGVGTLGRQATFGSTLRRTLRGAWAGPRISPVSSCIWRAARART
ncbi:hypothetical protein NUW58_g10213 [Xylaria curta]|uniref:Uncharacterized protein n=1 Tax=Xylaria curta TaxID=42375 RepID=A0ACC1MQA7_9PEZI|nr:hypothetical protein NUW58_g10213 [Xylaria curta]